LRRYPGRGFSVEEGGYVGTPSRIVDHLGAQISAGIDQFVFIPYDRGAADTLDLLAEEVLPHFV
jgi:alkanesulfonate monooxygenase SsuD/methylene tetrahydromethanopterin reductase-like flavin-dependent oxidoreductase (luciferase family)